MRQRVRTTMACAGLFLMLWMVPLSRPSIAQIGGGGGSGGTTFTTSNTHHVTTTDVTSTVQALGYQVEVRGILSASTGARTVVYARAVQDGVSPALTRGAMEEARQAVIDAAGGRPVVFQPGEIGASQVQDGSGTQTGVDVDHVESSVTTSVAIGPGTIFIGEDQSQMFFVAAGTTNVNTNTHYEQLVNDVTRTVSGKTKKATCDVVGVIEGAPAATGSPGATAQLFVTGSDGFLSTIAIGADGRLSARTRSDAGLNAGRPLISNAFAQTRVYVPVGDSGNAVDAFGASVSGAVAAQTGSPFPDGGVGPIGVAAGNRTLYAVNQGSRFRGGTAPPSISALTLDTDGNVTGSLPGSPFAIAAATQNELVTSMAADPGGRFLFAASATHLFAFKVNGDGTLTASPAPLQTNSDAVRMIVDSSGTVLYVTSGGVITSYVIQADASLTVSTSSAADPTHVREADLALSADGRFLYVSDLVSPGIRAFDAQTLAPLSGSPFGATTAYTQLALDPSGRFLYAATPQGIFGFNVQSDGSLSPIEGSPFTGVVPEFMRAGAVK